MKVLKVFYPLQPIDYKYKKILIEYRKPTWFQQGTIIRSYYSFTVSDVNESAVMSDAR